MPGQITAVEDLIAQGADIQLVIRLLCLASITAGGIKGKTLENIKKELLQVSGRFESRNDSAHGAAGVRI